MNKTDINIIELTVGRRVPHLTMYTIQCHLRLLREKVEEAAKSGDKVVQKICGYAIQIYEQEIQRRDKMNAQQNSTKS